MRRRLTLSFDNGPFPGITDMVLEALERYSIRASFFLVGGRLRDSLALAAAGRAKAAGHWIGNHTMTHGKPLGERAEPDHPEREIGDAETMLGDLAEPVRLFRPNGGGRTGPHLLSTAAVDYLVAHRYTVVTWNSVPRDWEPPADAWIERALADIARQDWTLLVLHDRDTGAMDHLPRFLDKVAGEVDFVQEFPSSCVPIRAGAVQPGIGEIVAEGA